TLLPREKREVIQKELATYADEHSEEIARFLRPIGEDVLEHTMSVLDGHLAPALKNHEKDIQALLDTHRDTLKDKLLPVLKQERELRTALRAIVEEALVRPFDASGLAKKLFGNEGHHARLVALEQSFGPTLRKIARLVSMDEKTQGISPDLARVLRRIVFG